MIFGIGFLWLLAPYPLEAQQRATGHLEFPNPGAILFGFEIITGWACNDGQQVTITIDEGTPSLAAYGGQRPDTQGVCGDVYNGFVYVTNFSSLAPGEHRICAYSGSAEIGCATVKVLGLGQDFIRDGSDEIQPLVNIPKQGMTLYMQWDTARQRPVVVDVKIADSDAATTLISHYYVSILGREPDAGGLAYWQNLITERQMGGEDVKPVFREMAEFFFNSSEYLGRNTTDGEFITDLYRTFFQREPDAAGLAYWLNQLATVVTRDDAMAGFLYSQEFTDFMQQLGF
jgi:hypothetical protein